MDLLLTALQFLIVFVATFAAVAWLAMAVDPQSRLPQALVFVVITAVASLTAYAVVIERPDSDCSEYSPQGSGRC